MNIQKNLFSSFLWGGYECAYSKLKNGLRIDLLADSKHDELCLKDYALAKTIGISTVREGLSWSYIARTQGTYDFSRFISIVQAGQEMSMQQVWDLNHFDYPEYLDPFSQECVDAFADYAQACVRFFRTYMNETLFIVPFNEISFFSYMGAKIGQWAPCQTGRYTQLRKNLVRASIAAMDAMWEIDDNIQFIQVDPIEHWQPKLGLSQNEMQSFNECLTTMYDGWDMLAGLKYPELGGNPKYLQLLGVNYYFQNQKWVESDPLDPETFVPMELQDEHRISLATMLQEVYEKYRCPIIISETGSYEPHRTKFWRRTLHEIDTAMRNGIPILGVCAYPLVDRPDWDDGHLVHSGLWDFVDGDTACIRVPHQPTIKVIRDYLARMDNGMTESSAILNVMEKTRRTQKVHSLR